VIADAYQDDQLGQPLMTIPVPIATANQIFVGAFVGNVTYRAVLTTLLVFAPSVAARLHRIGSSARGLLRTRGVSACGGVSVWPARPFVHRGARDLPDGDEQAPRVMGDQVIDQVR
jgi:hypothetical protein